MCSQRWCTVTVQVTATNGVDAVTGKCCAVTTKCYNSHNIIECCSIYIQTVYPSVNDHKAGCRQAARPSQACVYHLSGSLIFKWLSNLPPPSTLWGPLGLTSTQYLTNSPMQWRLLMCLSDACSLDFWFKYHTMYKAFLSTVLCTCR